MSNLTHGGDLEWATWKRGEKIFSIAEKTAAERAAEAEAAPAPRPEDYTFVGRRD
jgi:hypothetical protein